MACTRSNACRSRSSRSTRHCTSGAYEPATHIAELYARWKLDEEALAEREKLVGLEPNEEAHLVNLGEMYFARGKKGDKEKAKELCTKAAGFNSLPQLNYALIRTKAKAATEKS